MQISKHFSMKEGCSSPTALRLGIDNTPSEAVVAAMKALAEAVLEPVRVHFDIPFSPTSWFRCAELEQAICWGGKDGSSFGRWCVRRDLDIDLSSFSRYLDRKSHPKGEAADFEIPSIPNLKLAKWIEKNCQFDQLILEHHDPSDANSGWIHCSFSSGNNRGDVFRIGPAGHFPGLEN
jgi:hypothetical protein